MIGSANQAAHAADAPEAEGWLAAGAGGAPAGMTIGARRYAMGFLLVVGILNVVDRQVINILAEPIKQDLGLLDWQLGMLTGLVFAIFYTFFGLPIAQLAERTSRPAVITGSLVLWSAFTIVCGFAHNFVQLCLARMGVAVGEAGCTPAAHSLISEYYPREKRASALAVYAQATPLGALVGMIVGGVVADHYGWRAAFIICGLPGFLLAIVSVLSLKEPRRSALRKEGAHEPGMAILPAIRMLLANRTFCLATSAGALKAFISYGAAAFTASFFFRNHAAELAELAGRLGMKTGGFLGLLLGLSLGIGGSVGVFLGGAIADRLALRDLRAWMTVPAIASLIAPVVFSAALLQGSVTMAIALLTVNAGLSSLYQGPVFAAVQSVAPPRTRAIASSFMLFIMSLIGLGLGPLAVGALSDFLAISWRMGPAEGLRWALIASSVSGLVAFGLFWRARRYIEADVRG